MVKQELFVGENYLNGFNGKKLLVVGHQCAADSKNDVTIDHDWANKYSCTQDNIELMEAVLQGGCPKKEGQRDPNMA